MGHRSPERKSSFPQLLAESREELWICFENLKMGQATVVSFQEHPYLNIETVHLCQSRVSSATHMCRYNTTHFAGLGFPAGNTSMALEV